MKEDYCAPDVFNAPHYAQGVKVTGPGTLLFLAGQVARDAQGNIVGKADFGVQARQALQNVKAMLEAAGGTMTDAVKVTYYLTDMHYRRDLIPIREEFFGPKLPPTTLVETPSLGHPDYMLEVDCIAFVNGGR
jgi:2-iminobutanoate/2-iminopropanoate deaminase